MKNINLILTLGISILASQMSFAITGMVTDTEHKKSSKKKCPPGSHLYSPGSPCIQDGTKIIWSIGEKVISH